MIDPPMTYSVRLAPTLNGYMHLGHAYATLVNQAYAKERGWRFNVRFDDTQYQYLAIHGAEGLAKIRAGWEADLDWLGIEVWEYSSRSGVAPRGFLYSAIQMPRPAFAQPQRPG